MADWISDYNTYVNMTVAELKELLKSKDLPVSGKKKDLIQYLIFIDYPQLFQVSGKFYDENQRTIIFFSTLYSPIDII